jgi:hypothetical protein
MVPATRRIGIMKSSTRREKHASVKTPQISTRLRGIEPSTHVRFRNSKMISQEAINLLLMDDIDNELTKLTPLKLQPQPINQRVYAHYAMPMVHPVTGKTITSYKKLMKDPVTQDLG